MGNGTYGTAWDAKWIELDQGSETSPEKYTVEMDFRIINDDAGIIFAGKDNSNFLMWQINTFEKSLTGLPVFVLISGSMVSILTTFIGETQIDQRINDYAAYGKLGFRQAYAPGDCDEQAASDNIVVKDGEGNILFADNFDKEVNTNFSVGRVEGSELVVNNALGLQNDVKSAAPMYRKDFVVEKTVKKATMSCIRPLM